MQGLFGLRIMITLRNYFPYHCAIPWVATAEAISGLLAWVKVEWLILAEAAAKALWAGKRSWEWRWSPPWGTSGAQAAAAGRGRQSVQRQVGSKLWELFGCLLLLLRVPAMPMQLGVTSRLMFPDCQGERILDKKCADRYYWKN